MPLNLATVLFPGVPGQPISVYKFPTPDAAAAFVVCVNARIKLNPAFESSAPRASPCPSTLHAESLAPDSDLTAFRDPHTSTPVGSIARLLGGQVAAPATA